MTGTPSIHGFENGKTRIMAEARAALRRLGIDYHVVMFELHATEAEPPGATLTITAEGHHVEAWFTADEILDSRQRVDRADVRHKIGCLVAGVKEPA